MRAFLLMLFTLAAACDAPASANPAPRCSAAGTCEAGRMCHAGFCILLPVADAGGAMDAPDARVGPALPEDAAVSAPRDAGAPPAATDASSDPTDAGHEDEDGSEDEMQSEPPCEGLLCCKLGEIMCDGACVNPVKDRDHCGGCDVSCRRGPCKLGICTHQ